jgi:hypothetical protein
MLTPATGFCLMCGMRGCSPLPQAIQKRCLPTKARAHVSRKLVFVGTNSSHPGLIYSGAWRRVMPPGPADFILLTLELTVLHEERVQGGSTGRYSQQPHSARWSDTPAHLMFWKVKAMLMRQVRPAARAQICVPPSQILSGSIGKPTPVGLANIFASIFRNSTNPVKPGDVWQKPHSNSSAISRDSVLWHELCEAGTGNIHQEPILPPEVEVANLCEAVTGNIYPNSRCQTCVKQGQETFTPLKVRPC